jgi:alcohol dehydrogenase class IV
MDRFETAQRLLREFKGARYEFGPGALAQAGRLTAELGRRAALVCPRTHGTDIVAQVEASLLASGVTILGRIGGASPNAPREDAHRIAGKLRELAPEVIVGIGGGSTLDAVKAAGVLWTLGGSLDDYFGAGRVTERLKAAASALPPMVAVQTAASSGSHLTKYSNITDVQSGQKKLIVDEAIVPARAVFDYGVTRSMSSALTADGALDGVSHALEVLYDSVRKPHYAKMMEIAHEVFILAVNHVERAVRDPDDMEARTALGLATDLGAYAIMLGGTNGAHLTSFSLVDVLSHGRACGLMNPYYAVFFAPTVQEPLRMVGRVFRDAGLTSADVDSLEGRALGIAVAEAMMALSRRLGLPVALREVEGFTDSHIARALDVAKDPQLRMKLQNMPVPLSPEMVDEYMRPILEAARDGDLRRVKNMPA